MDRMEKQFDLEEEKEPGVNGEDSRQPGNDKDNELPEKSSELEDSQAPEDLQGVSEDDRLIQLEKQLEEKARESQENYERFLRALADLDNMKKRFQKEKEELLRFAARPLIEKLLPVMDDFTRAVTASKATKDFDALCQGVEMVQKKLMEILRSEGVTPIEAVNQQFDPRYHESLAVEDNPNLPDNIVIEEYQKGYLMRGRLLRPSLVKVARNPGSQEEDKANCN